MAAPQGEKKLDANTFVGNLVDRGPWQLYDTVVIAQAASTGTSILPFSVPISSTKTKLLTNMSKANQLPAPQRFLMRSLGFMFSATTILADQNLICENCYFEFRIDQKIYHEGRMEFYPSGLGIAGASTANNQQAWQIGQQTLTARRDFGDFARLISDNLTFSLSIIFPTAQTMTTTANGGVGVSLVCVLDGILDRSVQ